MLSRCCCRVHYCGTVKAVATWGTDEQSFPRVSFACQANVWSHTRLGVLGVFADRSQSPNVVTLRPDTCFV